MTVSTVESVTMGWFRMDSDDEDNDEDNDEDKDDDKDED